MDSSTWSDPADRRPGTAVLEPRAPEAPSAPAAKPFDLARTGLHKLGSWSSRLLAAANRLTSSGLPKDDSKPAPRIAAENLVVIVRISHHHVSATIAESNPEGRDVVLAHCAIDCVWQELNHAARREAVGDVLRQISARTNIEPYSVFLSMADPSIASRSVVGLADTGDEMKFTQAERAWALRRAAEQATCADDERVDIIPEKWLVRSAKGEHEVANPVGEHGSRLLCHALLVTARVGYKAELHSLVEGLNVEVEGIIAQPLALYYAIRKDLPKRGTALIIDSGARCTTIMLRTQGRLVHLQTYAFGGDDLTRAIADGLHISPAQAEALKCDLDISAEADPTYHHDGQQFIWGEVRERNRLALPASRIAAELIDRFFRARADELRDMGRLTQNGQVHLFGRTCALGGLAARLKDVLGLPVVLGTGNKERDPGAEMSDALVSGLVCAAADMRRQHLDANPDPLRKTATGVWDWLTKRVE